MAPKGWKRLPASKNPPKALLTRIDHLELNDIQRLQFEAVYPLIQEKMKTRGLGWIFDISNAIDGNRYLLVDHAHVTDEGNHMIAEAIKLKIGSL